jgi:hypothetical protein
MIFVTLNLNKMKYIRKRLMFLIYSDRSAPFKNYVRKLFINKHEIKRDRESSYCRKLYKEHIL